MLAALAEKGWTNVRKCEAELSALVVSGRIVSLAVGCLAWHRDYDVSSGRFLSEGDAKERGGGGGGGGGVDRGGGGDDDRHYSTTVARMGARERRYMGDLRDVLLEDGGRVKKSTVMSHMKSRHGWSEGVERGKLFDLMVSTNLVVVHPSPSNNGDHITVSLANATTTTTRRTGDRGNRSDDYDGNVATQQRRRGAFDPDNDNDNDGRAVTRGEPCAGARRERSFDDDPRSTGARLIRFAPAHPAPMMMPVHESQREVVRFVTIVRSSPVFGQSPISFPPPLMFVAGMPNVRPWWELMTAPPPFIVSQA